MEPVPTGVAGLDRVLNGGLRPRALHVFGGLPGTGKTTLAQQISYHHAKTGGRVLYLAALTETSDRLVEHASSFSFFDPTLVANRVYYVSLYGKLEEGGLPAVLDEIRKLSVEHRATLVCLDGLSTLKSAAPSPLDFRRFVFDLNTQLRSLGATGLVLGPWADSEASDPEFAVADGIIILSLDSRGHGAPRYLEVLKFRGSEFVSGSHALAITQDGLEVFPKLEATVRAEDLPEPSGSWVRVSTGSSSLDVMLHGGLPSGSITLVAGLPGAGRTVLGLGFLAEGGRRGEAGLYFGSSESPPRLLRKADALGLGLGKMVEQGTHQLYWSPSLGMIPDRAAWTLLDLVDKMGVQRLVIDDIDGILFSLKLQGRSRAFLASMMNALRSRNITTIVTEESARLHPTDLDSIYEGIGTAVDNALVLRYVERRSEHRRLISILKVRDSDFDQSFRAFSIGEGGIIIGERLDSADEGPAESNPSGGRRAQ